jgi:hypothetical protein
MSVSQVTDIDMDSDAQQGRRTLPPLVLGARSESTDSEYNTPNASFDQSIDMFQTSSSTFTAIKKVATDDVDAAELKEETDKNANISSSSSTAEFPAKADRKRSLFKKRVVMVMDSVDFDQCDLETGISTLKVPSPEKYTALTKKIRSSNSEWLEKFLQYDGLEVLLDAIGTISHRRVTQLSDAMMLLKCISCVKEVMNSKMGLDHLIANKEASTKLIKGIKMIQNATLICKHHQCKLV